MNKENNVSLNSAKAWMLAARPKTLAGAAMPVMVALALAWVDCTANGAGMSVTGGGFKWLPAVLCVLFAFLMQIDANFVNDYFDFMKGTDDEHRLGPRRACASGWVTASAMRKAMVLTTLAACVVGLPLISYGGWGMLLIGVLCVVFCLLYTTHLSYMGWGDALVLIFFGVVPVCATYYIQTHVLTTEIVVASLACGLATDALLIVNNYRDRDNDRRTGKMTLIVRIGERRGERLYLMVGLAAFAAGFVFLMNGRPMAFALPAIYLALHVKTYREMKHIHRGKQLNTILGATARNIFLYGVLVAVGVLAGTAKACAKTPNDTTNNERDHVRVTMNDGSVRDGYVTRYWSDGGAFRVMNRKFTLREGATERELTADEVKAVDFVVPNPQSVINENVVSADVANPSTLHPRRVKRQFVHLEGTTDNGSIYWWNAVDKQQMQLGQLTVSTIFGVQLAGDSVVIPFMTGNVISLNAMRIHYKKTGRRVLTEYLDKRILKGGKSLWSNIQQSPTLLLDLIGEFNDNKNNSK